MRRLLKMSALLDPAVAAMAAFAVGPSVKIPSGTRRVNGAIAASVGPAGMTR